MPDSPRQDMEPASHREIIACWPSLQAYADDIGADYNTAKKHRQRNSIPGHYWGAIVSGAEQRQLRGISHELLAKTATARERAGVGA